MKKILFGALALALATAAHGQTRFRADLNGAQETPPVATAAAGYAILVLNADDTLTYEVLTTGVVATAAHIHMGAVGVAGPVLFTLAGGPSTWAGTTTPLSAADKTALRARGLYINVHSAAFPTGEIRGQIEPRPVLFGAHLTHDQEVPPTGSAALGEATFSVNLDNTITYMVTVTGVSGTAAHIHFGSFGATGGVLFGLSGGPTVWAGTTAAMTAADFDKLQAKALYVNVHSAAFSTGEIRGQIVPTEVPYGFGGASSAGVPSLHVSGSSMRGGAVSIAIAGGLPLGGGLLGISLTDGLADANGPDYLLGAPLLLLPLGLNGAGALTLSGTIPDLSASIDIYLQFFGFEPGGPNGNLYATNGVLLPIFDY